MAVELLRADVAGGAWDATHGGLCTHRQFAGSLCWSSGCPDRLAAAGQRKGWRDSFGGGRADQPEPRGGHRGCRRGRRAPGYPLQAAEVEAEGDRVVEHPRRAGEMSHGGQGDREDEGATLAVSRTPARSPSAWPSRRDLWPCEALWGRGQRGPRVPEGRLGRFQGSAASQPRRSQSRKAPVWQVVLQAGGHRIWRAWCAWPLRAIRCHGTQMPVISVTVDWMTTR
jgi:hypothetical protein